MTYNQRAGGIFRTRPAWYDRQFGSLATEWLFGSGGQGSIPSFGCVILHIVHQREERLTRMSDPGLIVVGYDQQDECIIHHLPADIVVMNPVYVNIAVNPFKCLPI